MKVLLIIAAEFHVDVHSQSTAAPPGLVCPAVEDYDPCSCDELQISYKLYSSLDCQMKRLGDTKASQILNGFLVPTVSPLASLNLTVNQLTHIPIQLAYFKYALTFDLSFNGIDSIPVGSFVPDFNLGMTGPRKIYLQNNQLTLIGPDLFVGIRALLFIDQFCIAYCKFFSFLEYSDYFEAGSVLDLSNNLLDRLEFEPFYRVLKKMYYRYSDENRLIISNSITPHSHIMIHSYIYMLLLCHQIHSIVATVSSPGF